MSEKRVLSAETLALLQARTVIEGLVAPPGRRGLVSHRAVLAVLDDAIKYASRLAAPQPEPPAGLREAIAALPVSKRHSDDWIERAAVYRLIEGAT